MKTIHIPLIVGGYHDGQRHEAPSNADFVRLPADESRPFIGFDVNPLATITLYDYERTKFMSGGIMFTFWVPRGQDGSVTLKKLLDGYNPKVTPK